MKLANYGLDRWLTLPRYVPEEDTRLMLKTCYRQYQQYSKVQTMLKNNLISLLDTAFPDVNRLFYQSTSCRWQRKVGGLCSHFLALRVRLWPV